MAATLYTSCYGRIRDKNVAAVAISLKVPPGWRFAVMARLAPTWEIMRYKPEAYVKAYRECILDRLDPHEMLSLLTGSILCCYERPGAFCHRRIVAEWIEQACGIKVPEWGWEASIPTVAEMIAARARRPKQMQLL